MFKLSVPSKLIRQLHRSTRPVLEQVLERPVLDIANEPVEVRESLNDFFAIPSTWHVEDALAHEMRPLQSFEAHSKTAPPLAFKTNWNQYVDPFTSADEQQAALILSAAISALDNAKSPVNSTADAIKADDTLNEESENFFEFVEEDGSLNMQTVRKHHESFQMLRSTGSANEQWIKNECDLLDHEIKTGEYSRWSLADNDNPISAHSNQMLSRNPFLHPIIKQRIAQRIQSTISSQH